MDSPIPSRRVDRLDQEGQTQADLSQGMLGPVRIEGIQRSCLSVCRHAFPVVADADPDALLGLVQIHYHLARPGLDRVLRDVEDVIVEAVMHA